MDVIAPSSKIFLGLSKIPHAGRGVFAGHAIKKGEVIEVCPVIVIPQIDIEHLKVTILHNYYFMWGLKQGEVAICLGFGSLYNHSYTPNATYKKHFLENVIRFEAIKNIAKAEEITVNYNYGNPDDKSKLWITEIPGANEE